MPNSNEPRCTAEGEDVALVEGFWVQSILRSCEMSLDVKKITKRYSNHIQQVHEVRL